MNTCANEKEKPLGEVLQSLGALAEKDDGLLNSLVCRFMEKHDNDAGRCLAFVTTVDAIGHDLDRIRNLDPDATLNYPPKYPEQGEPDPDAAPSQAAGTRGSPGSRFQPIQFHARGGLGEVWIARDVELNRDVALKQIQNGHADNPQSRARFRHEAEVTGRLEHRGIVPVYGRGHFENGRPFYAMRFVSGTSLKDAIAAFHAARVIDPAGVDRSLELRRLLGRFVDVCNTVAFAHSRGVLHRDLKPANIILDEYGETLVVDWGLAKTGAIEADSASTGVALAPVVTSNTPYTWAGTKMGTPGYMSPEQAMGLSSEAGPESDVYSLGATLYCLLTGKAPFDEPDQELILSKVRAGDFTRPRQVEPTVPVALEAVCLKAMALAPEGRYSSPRALGDEIERWLADQPVRAYPEPFPTRAARWLRRRKQWIAAAAALLVLSVVGLAIYDWRITAEKARTTEQLAMTRDGLRELLRVSGENLTLLPNTEKLREHLAQLVLDRYQQLGDRFPADPGIRFETAQVLHLIGGIGRMTGQFARPQDCYNKAIQELTSLCNNDPSKTDYRRWLVEVFTDRGELSHMFSRTLDAEHDFHEAITQADKLWSEPASPSYRRAIGPALINLSEILVLECRHPEALTAAARAVDVLRPLAIQGGEPGSTTRDRWLLSLALLDRGIASREAGDPDRADRDFDEAARVAGSVAPDDELYEDAQFQLACIANQRGELSCADPAKLPESERAYEQATQILTRLMSNHKLIPHFREEMAVALCGRAAVRRAMARIGDSQRDCEAALDHLHGLIGEEARKGAPENSQYLSLLGQALEERSRLHYLQGRLPEGRSTHAEAVDKLSRAVLLDPARAADKVRLKEINARPAQFKE